LNGCDARKDGFHILQETQGTISFCGYKGRLNDMAIRVRITILQGDCGGIAFRDNPDTKTGYFFFLCQNGKYGLQRFDPHAKPVARIPSTPIPGNLQRTMTIAVVALGSTLTLFVEGKQMTSIEDTHYLEGVFGFAALNIHHPTEVVYNDLQVWTVKP
jgi:eukaryotic-like serine/threonine-protein kinase